VRDFFLPKKGETWCTMLASHNKHQWSPNGVDWVTPKYLGNVHVNGGSAENW
jgi:hypothetical protein